MQRQAARRVRDMLRGPTEVAPEHWADYLALAAGDPRSGDDGSGAVARWDDPRCRPGLPEQVAREPRLRDEGRSFETSARPASERLDDIGFINGDVRTELLDFLADRRLQDSRRWLQELADERYQGRITHRWELEAHSVATLSNTALPLLKSNGEVEKSTKLRQEAPGSQPYALVGDGNTMRIKWVTNPKTVESVARWRAELIPSRNEQAVEDAAIELPRPGRRRVPV